MPLKIKEVVSKELNISPENLEEEGITAYLERNLRLAEEDVADLRDRYGVISAKELEELIAKKKVASHPAWEDLITWENLENYIQKIKQTLRKIGARAA